MKIFFQGELSRQIVEIVRQCVSNWSTPEDGRGWEETFRFEYRRGPIVQCIEGKAMRHSQGVSPAAFPLMKPDTPAVHGFIKLL